MIMATKKKTYILEYKRKEHPWTKYDQTQDLSWANVQLERMKKDHEGAEYRIIEK